MRLARHYNQDEASMADITNTQTDGLLARIAQLEQQVVEARKPKPMKVTMKTRAAGGKACVGVTGIRNQPVSFYRAEWLKIFSMVETIKAFMEEPANKAELDAQAIEYEAAKQK